MQLVRKIPVKEGYFPFITGSKKIEEVFHTIFVLLPKYTEGEPMETFIIKGRIDKLINIG